MPATHPRAAQGDIGCRLVRELCCRQLGLDAAAWAFCSLTRLKRFASARPRRRVRRSAAAALAPWSTSVAAPCPRSGVAVVAGRSLCLAFSLPFSCPTPLRHLLRAFSSFHITVASLLLPSILNPALPRALYRSPLVALRSCRLLTPVLDDDMTVLDNREDEANRNAITQKPAIARRRGVTYTLSS